MPLQRDGTARRYANAEISAALQRRPDYWRAAQELAGCLHRLYPGGGKALQAALAADAFLAVEQCDMRPASRGAAAAVARAGERLLPRAKAQRLARGHRARQVALQRAEPKPGVEPDAAGPELFLPPDLLDQVLAVLDPVSLAACACVCRVWRAAANASPAWQVIGAGICAAMPWQAVHFQRCHRRGFIATVTAEPAVLDQWRSRRIQADGRLAWLPDSHPALGPPHCRQPLLALRRTEAGRARSNATFPTIDQVVTHFIGGRDADACDSDSSEDDRTPGFWNRSRLRGMVVAAGMARSGRTG